LLLLLGLGGSELGLWSWSWSRFNASGKVGTHLSELGNLSWSINDLTALSISDNWSDLLVVGGGQGSWAGLLLANWLRKFKGGRSGWSNNDSVFNVVKLLSESWSPHLDTSVCHSWLSYINKLLGDSLCVCEFGYWNISNSRDLNWNLVMSVTNLLSDSNGW
jgi:hypothetical protein